MPRLRNVNSGAIVSVADELVARLGSEWQPDDGGTGEQVDEGYKALKVPELEAEIDSRNKGREDADRISPEGTKKADLIAALEADDNKSAEQSDNK